MSADEIKGLNRKRGAVKREFTMFVNYLSGVQGELSSENSDVDQIIHELKFKIKYCENLWEKFEGYQTEIEALVDDENLEKEYSERVNYCDKYLNSVALGNELIRKYSKRSNSDHGGDESVKSSNGSVSPGGAIATAQQRIKLPVIELPKFNGKFNQWLEFKNTFESLIHCNESIINIQKFHYLRASLQGDALNLIQSLELTSHNYDVAWKIICERYNNKRMLVQNHLKSIFEFEAISKESSRSIRHLIDTVFKHLRALESLGQPVKHWDSVLIYVIVAKMDKASIKEWEKGDGATDSPKLKSLKLFLNKRADFLETFELNHLVKHREKSKTEGSRSVSLLSTNSGRQRICVLCKGDHLIYTCKEFLELSVSDRIKKVKTLNLCFNCLRIGHTVANCRNRNCGKCHKRHNLLLHLNIETVAPSDKTDTTYSVNDSSNSNAQISLISSQNRHSALLSTAIVLVADKYGNYKKCRAILDCGSMSNLVTSNFANKLMLTQSEKHISIVGINQVESQLNASCKLKIKSIHSDYTVEIECFVVPHKITGKVPIQNLDISSFKVPDEISLADSEFGVASDIDLLIGAELFWDLLEIESLDLGKNLPRLQKTTLGWVVVGTINQRMVKSYCNVVKVTNQELSDTLIRFWELEEVTSNIPLLSSDEQLCESHFEQTYTRNKEGRFVVQIPLKLSRNELGDSKTMARKRFLNLERKLDQNLELKQSYSKFMKDYIDMGHMEISEFVDDLNICYYLPHHGIIRPDSLSTKLRVVFDGSAATDSGLSLNDIQLKGPACQNDIVNILVRFRQFHYVVCADIAKMYRQILVHPNDQPLQQIFWRFCSEENLQIYTLRTVTYGTASAPYLAIRCLKQLALDVKESNPQASHVIDSDFYVDDLIAGFDSVDEAVRVCNDVTKILKDANFHLRKWSSNCKDILAKQDHVDQSDELLFNNDETIKTLGMVWNRKSDTVSFYVQEIPDSELISKRFILSNISKLYDPLGLVSPCIIVVKILIQKLWSIKLDWDMPIPADLEQVWTKFKNNLHCLNNIKLSRHAICVDPKIIEIHGFCDASCEAYAASIYLRSVNKNGEVFVHLLASKTKVAPLKQKLTVPKLELSGALLLTRLTNKVLNAITIKNINCFMWSDSQIVLAWIKGSHRALPRFESNRVNEIQNSSKNFTWSYINTKHNPADIASRGILPNLIENCELWWFGPEILKSNNREWHVDNKEKPIVSCLVVTNEFDLFHKFSSFTRLIRVVAHCLRFYHNLKGKKCRVVGYLTVNELNESLNLLIKICQRETFPDELKLLSEGKILSKSSKIVALAPFIDKDGIIRVGGRLRYASLDYNCKHPILLHGKHAFTKLMVESEHRKMLHAGPQLLLATIRQKYWPTSGLSVVKRVVRDCITCYKFNPQSMSTFMADLPEDRVKITSPFYSTGLDYAGPFYIKEKKGRGSKLYKAYICIFVCLTTKAVHIELVTDLTTDLFLAALKRFCSRRGKPSCIYSDNAKNFVGAKEELKKLYDFVIASNDKIADTLANDNISWKFIPPRAPHFGGIWEAAVKSCKHHLLRVIGNIHFTYEEFYTLVVQIEAIMNSRPIYPLSSDPSDILPLTPSHFLIGKPMVAVPEPDLAEIKINKLSRLQLLQNITQDFWKSWSREYFATLQRRNKWNHVMEKDLKINSLVLIKDGNLPPCKWRTGRVTALHPGKDGHVRVVSVSVVRCVKAPNYSIVSSSNT